MNQSNFKNLKRLTFVLLLCWGNQLFAQQVQVRGVVQDITGAAIPGVSIRAENKTLGNAVVASSSSQGLFSFSNLAAGGPYNFIFSYMGFQTDTLANYTVRAGQEIALNIKLKEQTTSLQEVVIGYGRSTRSKGVKSTCNNRV
jgi:hypothetical protein